MSKWLNEARRQRQKEEKAKRATEEALERERRAEEVKEAKLQEHWKKIKQKWDSKIRGMLNELGKEIWGRKGLIFKNWDIEAYHWNDGCSWALKKPDAQFGPENNYGESSFLGYDYEEYAIGIEERNGNKFVLRVRSSGYNYDKDVEFELSYSGLEEALKYLYLKS